MQCCPRDLSSSGRPAKRSIERRKRRGLRSHLQLRKKSKVPSRPTRPLCRFLPRRCDDIWTVSLCRQRIVQYRGKRGVPGKTCDLRVARIDAHRPTPNQFVKQGGQTVGPCLALGMVAIAGDELFGNDYPSTTTRNKARRIVDGAPAQRLA